MINSEKELKDGEPCNHKGCLNHGTHPCEGCGRVAGVAPKQECRAYGRYEFCLETKCGLIKPHPYFADQKQCTLQPEKCIRTAKQFHKWLSKNGFMILKPVGAGITQCIACSTGRLPKPPGEE